MVNYIQLAAVILAGIAVAIADALIKKTAISGNLGMAFKNPLMLFVILLYLAQVVFFVYVFAKGWDLAIGGNLQMIFYSIGGNLQMIFYSIGGNLQMIFYSIGVVLIGLLVFGETLTAIQGMGILLALIGVILINL